MGPEEPRAGGQAFLPRAPPLAGRPRPPSHLTSLGGAEDRGLASVLSQGEGSVSAQGLEALSCTMAEKGCSLRLRPVVIPSAFARRQEFPQLFIPHSACDCGNCHRVPHSIGYYVYFKPLYKCT